MILASELLYFSVVPVTVWKTCLSLTEKRMNEQALCGQKVRWIAFESKEYGTCWRNGRGGKFGNSIYNLILIICVCYRILQIYCS